MVNLITDHMDVWTSAQIQKTNGVGRGNGSANHGLHGIKKLRELILELAVRGKLVPQDPNDEPASVLLKKIAKEKLSLIDEGKIKKQKLLIEIQTDEKHFIIPKGWAYTRNGNLFSLIKGKNPKNLSEENIGLPYLDIEALDRDNILRYTDDERCPRSSGDDILVVCDGSRSGLILNGKMGVIGSTLAVIDTPKYIQPYVKLLFREAFQRWNTSMKGAAIPHLDTKNLIDEVIGLPPQNEQHRIVAKVDELMAICDQLEQKQTDSNAAHQTLVETLLATLTSATNQDAFIEAWQSIASHFDILFTTEQSIDQLKQTILQLAVMGKLVLQDPSDEPASVLLEKIAKEKARLIKEGKIKKQESLPEISEDEKLFVLPKGWALSRLQTVLDVRDGTHDSPKDAIGPDTYPLVTSKNFYNGVIRFDEARRISSEDHLEISKRSLVEKYDILFSMIGGNLGNQVMVNDDRSFSVKNVALFKYYNKKMTSPFFIKKFMEHLALDLQSKAAGGAQPFVSLGFLRNLVIAVPPLNEQHRIVAKVDELMTLCDTLKACIKDAQAAQIQLADAIVEQAVV